MTIRFNCINPGCRKTMKSPDETAGKRARCPACGQVQTIPAAPEPVAPRPPAAPLHLDEPPAAPAPRQGESAPAMNTCVVCGASYPQGQACPTCRPASYRPAFSAGGGKWVTIAVAVLLFAGLMTGAYFVIKGLAKTGEEYGKALGGAEAKSGEVACALQLDSIYKSIRIATTANDGRLPDRLEELYPPGELHCPVRGGPAYKYVPGQTQSMPPDNVLVYEAEPFHKGKCSVLRLNGVIELLTPAELAAALAKTRQAIAAAEKAGRGG